VIDGGIDTTVSNGFSAFAVETVKTVSEN
jgi:hypothetical protein